MGVAETLEFDATRAVHSPAQVFGFACRTVAAQPHTTCKFSHGHGAEADADRV